MKGKTLKQITNTPKAGLRKLSSLPSNENFNIELISDESGKKYTIDVTELSNSTSGIQSLTAGDNITIDNTDPLNPIISGISSLFPNGAKLVETDRTLQADDAGYALLLSDGVQLTIPTISPLSPGQYFGITTNSATASFILEGNPSELAVYLSYAGQEAALVNEVVTYVAADVGGNTSLILLTQIAGSNDTVMTANRYFFEQLQNVNSYSTDEKRTGGTWIDGKPIYRKVFEIYGDGVNNQIIESLESFDIENLVLLNTITNASDEYHSIDSYSYIRETSFFVSKDSGYGFNIQLVIQRNGVTPFNVAEKFIIKVEYTKTTD